MKVNKIFVVLLAVVMCMVSLSFVFSTVATEQTEEQGTALNSDDMYSKELIYLAFENDKIEEISIASADWKSFVSYSDKDSNWSNWDDIDSFTFPCKLTTYYRTTEADAPTGAVLYVVGHSVPRLGTETDVPIVDDFLDDGYIVVVADFLDNENAVAPYIECAATILRYEIGIAGKFVGSYYKEDLKFDTFIIPAGYRMVRNIEFFDVPEQAATGTLEYIVSCYNKDATKNVINKSNTGVTWSKAETIDDVIMPNGKPITDKESGNYDKHLKYRLDIYYPSNPEEEVPLYALASSSDVRTQLVATKVVDRVHGAGALFNGYALAVYDHEYTSFMLGRDSWRHINSAGFSLQSANGVKMHTAAIRCLKYYAEDYGYSNEKIGVTGHSKSSYVVTLSGPNPDELYESNPYSDQKRGDSYGEQPFLTYRDGVTPITSDVTCVYHSMGAGSINRQHFLTPSNVPTFIACGVLDDATPAPKDYWEQEFKDYREMGIPFVGVYMPEIGHTYPPYIVDPIYGYNYYECMRAFFAYYLKGAAPEVVYTGIESNGIVDIDDKGLFIYFSAPITEWSLLKSVSVTDANGDEVEGTWFADCGGSRWVFKTDFFIKGDEYTVTLEDTAADMNGVTVKEGFTKSFEAK